ncbi:MAG: hypothetical protein WBC44_10760 [Planctomycetaceae bacterium]
MDERTIRLGSFLLLLDAGPPPFPLSLTKDQKYLINGGRRGEITEGVLEHVARFKSFTTKKAWESGLKGLLWQKSSYDRVFDLERPFQDVARYVLENPVRRGLAKRWEDWPYARIVDRWEVE